MKSYSIIGSKKKSGKTHIASIAISAIMSVNRTVSYYKPFIMNVINNQFTDIENIKNTTNIKVQDIYTSFACSRNISPYHSSDIPIDTRDINDLIDDISLKYDIMLLEALGIYDPIKEKYLFSDLILDMPKSTDNSAILVIDYDSDVISQTFSLIESIINKEIKISMVIINQNKNTFTCDKVLDYIAEEIDPIKMVFTPFENNASKEKIVYTEEKYGKILDTILLG